MNAVDPGFSLPSSSAAQPGDAPHYGSPSSNKKEGFRNGIYRRSIASVSFLTTIHGLLDIIILVALICILISAGLTSSNKARNADQLSYRSNVKLSAYNTRNANLAFAAIGLIVILADIIIYMTPIIKRLPQQFGLISAITLFVLAAIYVILGCCTSAVVEKMFDTTEEGNSKIVRGGGPIATAIFLFIAMIATILSGAYRLIRPRSHDTTT